MSIDNLDFKESCQVLMQEKQDELFTEFNEKKQFGSIYDAYSDRNEALKKFRQFKRAGFIHKSWKRSVGLLRTSNRKEYRRKWNEANKDKMLGYTRKWLNRKFNVDTINS